MSMDFSTPKRGKNVFEYLYGFLTSRRNKDQNVVQCVNQQNINVEPLDPFRPFLRFDQLKNKLIGFIFVASVALSDEKYLTATYKVWLVSVAAMLYLLYTDYGRIPIRYVHPARFTGEMGSEDSQYNRTIHLEEEQVIKEFISVSQCEFHILQVKVIDQNDGITNSGLHAPVAGSRAIFQITIICGRSRWEVWRKYEHFCKVYDNLCTKYANHKIAKLPSLERIKRTWKGLSSESVGSVGSGGEGGSTGASGGSTGASGASTGVSGGEDADLQDDATFLGHSFLQKLQAEMLGWLRTMQLDPIGDDASLRALLKLPAYKAHVNTGGFGATPNRGLARVNSSGSVATSHASIHRGAHISTGNNGGNSAGAGSASASGHSSHHSAHHSTHHNHHTHSTNTSNTNTTDTNNTYTTPSTTHPTPDTTTTAPDTDTSTTTTTNTYISPCGCWKGNSVESFQWLDMDQKARDMFIDIKYSHDFKVRGPTYLTDKKKIDAGPSISKLLLMENFHVNTAKYGDRLDHISSIGRVKRRIEIMHNLPGNPFVIILNLQIPGDPPVSIVFYFLVPTSFYPGKNPSDGLDATREMFRKLIDCPITPMPEENAEYLAEVAELSLQGRSMSGDSSDRGHSANETAHDKKKAGAHSKGAATQPATKHKSSFYVPPAPKSWTADVVWPDMKTPQPGVLAKDTFQNKRFKLIPSMVEAPWVVQMAVSSTPVMLGQKVVQRYFRGEGYLECDVHIGSSAIADNIVGVCRSYSKAFICNLGIVIQGESADELPEHVLACAALKYCDVEVHSPLESYNF